MEIRADPGELAAEALEFIDGGRLPAIEAEPSGS
jgi:hypothetical protein